MKIAYLSDLHADAYSSLNIVVPECDVLLLAGDMATTPDGAQAVVQYLRNITDAPILYVLGNHEYYGFEFPTIRKAYRNQVQKIEQVYLLERREFVLDKVRFLGTTLWSDLSNPLDATMCKMGLNDFNLIQHDGGRLTTSEYTEEWKRNSKWLRRKLRTDFEGVTVVFTHHSPSEKTCAKQYRRSTIRHAFHSKMEDMLDECGPPIWIYGHDHVTAESTYGETALLSNQAGYAQDRHGAVLAKVVEVLS